VREREDGNVTLTPENKAKLNALVRLLRDGNVTKQRVMDLFKVSERTAYNENKKRAGEILKRNEPLEKFIKENRV